MLAATAGRSKRYSTSGGCFAREAIAANASQSLSPRVSSADGISNADAAGREDVGAQAASVDHRAQQGGAGEALQVRAGFAQPSADAAGGPDLELLADECVEVDAAGHDVATRVDRRQMEVVVAERVEDFRFDERQLLSVLLARGERACAVEVAVADDATAGAQLDGLVGCIASSA